MSTIAEKVKLSKELIQKVVDQYPKIAVASSFGKDSMVVLHLALSVAPGIRVFTVMTRFKPIETFQYKDMMIKEWSLNIEEYSSKEMLSPMLPFEDPEGCCRLLKVEPTKKALRGLDAWITGLRKSEGKAREDYRPVERRSLSIDGEEKLITKVNPILGWEEIDIWKYLAMNRIPVHPFYALGYRSLGCAPCSSIVDDLGAERAGRWKGFDKCECGIHTEGRIIA